MKSSLQFSRRPIVLASTQERQQDGGSILSRREDHAQECDTNKVELAGTRNKYIHREPHGHKLGVVKPNRRMGQTLATLRSKSQPINPF